jgi:hypothetical protein
VTALLWCTSDCSLSQVTALIHQWLLSFISDCSHSPLTALLRSTREWSLTGLIHDWTHSYNHNIEIHQRDNFILANTSKWIKWTVFLSPPHRNPSNRQFHRYHHIEIHQMDNFILTEAQCWAQHDMNEYSDEVMITSDEYTVTSTDLAPWMEQVVATTRASWQSVQGWVQ